MCKCIQIVTLFVLLSSSVSVLSQKKIEKAFVELNQYNYFESKKLFKESLKKYESISSFGLASIYTKNDNPFYNLDSAIIYAQRAEKTYSVQSEKQKIKFKKLNFDYPAIFALRESISSKLFLELSKTPTVESLTNYSNLYPFAKEINTVIHRRDSMAFEKCTKIQSSTVFAQFNKEYPNSEYFERAKDQMYLLQYQEETRAGSLQQFIGFIRKNPQNTYVSDADDRIYDIVCAKNSEEAFQNFIKNYPTNRNVNRAWRNLYKISTSDYNEKETTEFLAKNTDYPFKLEIETDKELSKQQFVPYKKDGLWGYMNHTGDVSLAPMYDVVGFFNESLAYAQKNRKFGYINKANETMINFEYDNAYDFNEGRALVEKNGKFGMIDRTGKLILPIIFSDLGNYSNGLVFGKIDSLYAYYDKFGFKRIPEKFQEAFDFENGKAIITINGKQGIIDEYGSYVVAPGVESLRIFTDSLYVFEENGMFGIIKSNYTVVLPAIYEEIGSLSDKRAIVSAAELFGYIDDKGALVIPVKYETYPNFIKLSQFEFGFAKVMLKEKYGLIDVNGKVLIAPTYTEMGQPSNLIAVTKGLTCGFCDKNGVLQTPADFEICESFKYGVGVASKLTLFGLINAKGVYILPAEYTEIRRLDKDFLMIKRGPKCGIVTNKGEIVVPVEYQKITSNGLDYYILQNAGEIDYFYKTDKLHIQPKIQ
jgi:hypothetical protein